MKEGLVQRRNVAHQSITSKGEEIGADDEKRRVEDEDLDSKETRLTLMEEVLLLGLKDREVYEIYCHFCYIFQVNLTVK